ncbi:RodZ domain-containing protein [Oleidesulfovibrio sp.]|uniref:helix-turn-helix domain-containing protein n=1 Tax=Oleidesulfovibrio sp. TaxID=2909707 RepID=UPI003A8AD715
MTLKELGEALRQEREARGISLKDAEKRTKIAARILASIEEGKQDNFPHPVYAKGFVKTYARLLGMDPEEAGVVVDRELVVSDEEEHAKPPQLIVKPRRNFAPVIIAILVIALLGAGGYVAYTKFATPVENSQAEVADEPAGAASNSSGTEAAPADAAAPETETGNVVLPSAPEAEQPASVEPQSAVEPTSEAVEATAETLVQNGKVAESVQELAVVEEPEAAPVVPVSAPAPAAVSGTQALRVTASLDCWIEARIDDARDQELFLRSGKSFIFRFDDSLVIKLGNGGGVALALNGKVVPVTAKPGEVVTLHFPQ